MPSINYCGRDYLLEQGETVLAALLRNNVDISYSCKAGVCHSCLMRRTDGEVPDSSQSGLRTTLKHQHYFLACQYVPEENIKIASADDEDLSSHARVVNVERLSGHVCKVQLEPSTPLFYHAGQFINLKRHDNLIRSYSLASVPGLDSHLEIHIKRMDNGQMSNWIHNELQAGDHIDIQGPYGNCFYLQDNPEQDLLLIGTGTGLAPLIGIVRDALKSRHRGNIYLYHGSRNQSGLYMDAMLKQLSKDYDQFHYIPCLSGESLDPAVRYQRAHQAAFSDFPNLQGMKVYLCGHPDMVKQAKMTAYLNNADLGNIYADPFDMKDLRHQTRS